MNLTKTCLALALGLSLALPLSAAKPSKMSPADMKAAEDAMKKSDCFACHQVKMKVVGPSYKDVAKKYKSDPKAVENLSLKVKNGGSGVWGQIPMAAHPALKDEDIKLMVRWVLAQK